MKKLLTVIAVFYASILIAQTRETNILIISCKSGELFIDGESKGKIEADDAHKEKVAFGEHYFQIKTSKDKFNLSLNVNESLISNIVKLGCDATTTIQSIKLIEKQLALSGLLGSDTENNYFGLDQDDQLNIQCAVLNKKGTASISIVQYETGSEIYKKESFTEIRNEVIRVPKRGIYKIILYTDALFGKNAKLVISRIPAVNSPADFSTSVHFVYDTTATQVLNTTTRVYSVSNIDHSNKTTLRINLPANTSYWTYWIGVGQESKQKMQSFISSLSNGSSLLTANPLFLFGMQLIPSLPMMNTTSTINYKFMDITNAEQFIKDKPYSYYKIKYGENIATDYALINAPIKDLSLCFTNESTMTGQDVEVRVMAFIINKSLAMDSQ